MTENILVILDDSEISYTHSEIAADSHMKVSFEQLYTIYKENVNSDILFSLNTIDCISIILDDGSEISLHQFPYKGHKPIMLKISNDEMHNADNDIILAIRNRHYISDVIKWQNIPGSITDYDYEYGYDTSLSLNGYDECQRIIKYAKNGKTMGNIKPADVYMEKKIPAIKYCDGLSLSIGNNEYKGYLPSIGQLIFIYKYIDLINAVLKKLNSAQIQTKYTLWGCPEVGYSEAYAITSKGHKFEIKQNMHKAMPLFHKV